MSRDRVFKQVEALLIEARAETRPFDAIAEDIILVIAKSLAKKGADWQRIRLEIIARDGHRCRSCGHQGRLDVHHRVPVRSCTNWEMINSDENLVALCRPCHAVADAAVRAVELGLS